MNVRFKSCTTSLPSLSRRVKRTNESTEFSKLPRAVDRLDLSILLIVPPSLSLICRFAVEDR
jgi:hypothetical protein